ncbi:MAG: serine--tRNA ligase [Candidatus Uhrbacteria bacterium]
MIDLKWLREHADLARAGLAAKNVEVPIDRILELDARVREVRTRVEESAQQRNAAAKRIGEESDADERKQLIERQRAEGGAHDEDRALLKEVERELDELVFQVPNLPLADVHVGKDESENEVIRKVGDVPVLEFTPKAHWELGPALNVYETERAARISGSRFGYLLHWGAKLEFALVGLAMQELEREGFSLRVPPVLINAEAMDGMGYTIHGEGNETYYFEQDNQYLVGTSEQSLGAYHMGEVMSREQLPARYAGFSTCFRRESGSYGKDTKGIFRVHQFDKVEMFVFTTPEESDAEHERLLGIEEGLMQKLELPYQVLKMCTGDLGIQAARKYDLEAWFPSEQRYRELTSTSTCTDWQARRLGIRYKLPEGGTAIVHTLNGTAFAISRTICAILENHQQEDGSVRIPEALRPFLGGAEHITREG